MNNSWQNIQCLYPLKASVIINDITSLIKHTKFNHWTVHAACTNERVWSLESHLRNWYTYTTVYGKIIIVQVTLWHTISHLYSHHYTAIITTMNQFSVLMHYKILFYKRVTEIKFSKQGFRQTILTIDYWQTSKFCGLNI